jgi:hypothetical protein
MLRSAPRSWDHVAADEDARMPGHQVGANLDHPMGQSFLQAAASAY